MAGDGGGRARAVKAVRHERRKAERARGVAWRRAMEGSLRKMDDRELVSLLGVLARRAADVRREQRERGVRKLD